MKRAVWVLGVVAGSGLSVSLLAPWIWVETITVEAAGEVASASVRDEEAIDEPHLEGRSSRDALAYDAGETVESGTDDAIAAAVAPPGPDPLYDLDIEPHPHTAERQANARQHALFDAVRWAIEEGDFETARGLLGEHARDFGDEVGWRDQRVGFELVLECLEHPGPASRARGEEFVALERLSPLRRRVRRTCLEGRPFSGRR